MFFSTVQIPEPFFSFLAIGTPGPACDLEAMTPEAKFGRAMARIAVGRQPEARQDLEAALPALGDACLLELAFLDVQQRTAVKDALATARMVVERAGPCSLLAARALHLAGLAEGRLRNTAASARDLLSSMTLYQALGERLGLAQVYDTLGMLEGARGRLDLALHFHALSLVDKTMLGDRPGMAMTLGNIGRIHLRAGRFQDAIFCFERDLLLARELGDERGQARMHEDLGRAHLGLENLAESEAELLRCLEIAATHNFRDLQFFARKDMALVRIAQARVQEAKAELAEAASALPEDAEPYLSTVLAAVQGELLLAEDDSRAIDVLKEAVNGFEEAELPDMEIPARISLARAYIKGRYKAHAEQCLVRGLRLARSDGYARYSPALNEAMAALSLIEGAMDEKERQVSDRPRSSDTSYIIQEQLGKGAFGDVFRVYDAERAREVALKRLRLGEVYDVRRRARILASARIELEAASRVRHPGIARVWAIGVEPDGGTYIVEELVPGRPLRALLPKDTSADPALVLSQLAKIAHALHALHGAGVVHRDLKPENIIIREDGCPVLVDFGIAHLLDLEASQDEPLMGTLPYMAPEQASGGRVGAQADIYALGVIAYEWLTGLRPLCPCGRTQQEIVQDIVTRQPPRLSHYRPDVTPELEQFVMSLLAKKARQRPANALAVAQKCETLCQGTLLRATVPPDLAKAAAVTRLVVEDGRTPGRPGGSEAGG
jgi:tRNA A-37 threonylcarbamoyl transferase component Bud32